MEASLPPTMDRDAPEDLRPPTRKRKGVEKRVVRVKIGAAEFGKEKSEGPPYDSWSWRKYGQKPIKGSPHPRAYYRCSTSKGCSAKKQVERCKTDPSVLVITYTSSHNHPVAPGTRTPKQGNLQEQVSSPQDQEEEEAGRDPNMPWAEAEDEFSYSRDFQAGEIIGGAMSTQLDNSCNKYGNVGLVPLSCNTNSNEVPPPATKLSGAVVEEEEGEEYFEFFDELEELYPTGLGHFSYGLREAEGRHHPRHRQLVR